MQAAIVEQEALFERIAAGLSGPGYIIIDHFLSEVEVQTLLDRAAGQFSDGGFKKAGIGRQLQLNEHIRGDYISWIDRQQLHPSCHFFLDRVEALSRYLNRRCFMGIRDAEFHFAIYPQGAGYQRHLDVFRHTSDRVVSMITYLNVAWQEADGGALRIYGESETGEENSLDVLPLAGRAVLFLSDQVEHAVLPARCERYSITGWMKNSLPLGGQPLFDAPANIA